MLIRFFFTVLSFVFSLSYASTVNETFVQSGEAQLFCRMLGQGTPLIVIHGGPGLTQDYLQPQMYALAENHFVIFYDQRGCGKSTCDINHETINLETYVKDIEAIRKAFKYEKVSILGHSFGGFIAQHYAIAHPEHIDKMILMSSMSPSSEEFALFMAEYFRRMAPFEEEMSQFYQKPGFFTGDPDLIEQLHRIIFRTYCYDPKSAELINIRMPAEASINGAKVHEIFRLDVFEKPFDFYPALKQVNVSTLIIHGDTDVIPSITPENLHNNIKGSKYINLKQCGHFPYIEASNECYKLINEFLN